MSPTERSLDYLRKAGYRPWTVERWNPHARIRQDAWGCIDIVALGEGEILAVQTTSASNLAARVRKIEESEAIGWLRKAGMVILCHGWKKGKSGRWEVTVRDLS